VFISKETAGIAFVANGRFSTHFSDGEAKKENVIVSD